MADGRRCRGRSSARCRHNRPHQVLEIQCWDRCGRCGRKWRPPFWCSGIAACLNDAVHGCQRILYQLTLDNGPGRREAVEWVGHGWVASSTVHGGGKRRFEPPRRGSTRLSSSWGRTIRRLDRAATSTRRPRYFAFRFFRISHTVIVGWNDDPREAGQRSAASRSLGFA
jgi:hypothetical protein